ncbi:MAG: hypothetical protein AB9M53_01155 [Leptothrix sp. (in: b-proteobacteria)]
MPLLFDLEALNARQTDDALDYIFKAVGHDHGGDGIWEPHDNPFLTRMVQLFTDRGLARIDEVRDELNAWLKGERHEAGPALARPIEAWQPLGRQELGVVKLYLQHLPPGAWTLDDHMLLIDYLQSRYFDPTDLRTESEWLATRGAIMGRVQASMARATAAQADAVLAGLPNTVEQALLTWSWKPAQRQVLQFAQHRAADAVTRVSDGMRSHLRQTIAGAVERAQMAGRPVWSTELETELRDGFALQNRDWRRVALTEAGEALNQGYIASLEPGAHVKRLEQYKGVCPFCAKIDGVVARVTSADDPDKDGETDIWPGKNNVGRSAAPRKRVGTLLVEREPHERWWLPAGLAHPNCRGRWLPVIEDQPGDDPDFAAYLRQTLGGAKA